MTTGIIVFAHGSRIEAANQAVRSVAADLARAADCSIVEAAFLEMGRPNLEEAADLLFIDGAWRMHRLVALLNKSFLAPEEWAAPEKTGQKCL